MPKPAPGKHRHADARRRDGRRERQRNFVADAARRMLIHLFARNHAQIHDRAGMQHGLGQGDRFLARHAAKKDRHRERGKLIIGNPASGVAVNQEANFVAGQLPAVAFLFDDVLRAHSVPSVFCERVD